MDTTIGGYQPIFAVRPATRAQLEALLETVSLKDYSPERERALVAIMGAIEACTLLAEHEERRDMEAEHADWLDEMATRESVRP